MFTFGSSPVLDLDNARLFAQQFQLEEDRPTLRRTFILLSGFDVTLPK